MRLIKKKKNSTYSIFLKDDKKSLIFVFDDNKKLYWSIKSKENVLVDNIFTITKNDNQIYSLFEQLFVDIKEINIFEDESNPFFIENEEERRKYLRQKGIDNNLKKARYRLLNSSNYNYLFDEENKIITWFSDSEDNNNFFKIYKRDDRYEIEFYGMMKKNSISVQISNIKSRYEPFNILFMRMFCDLNKIDKTSLLSNKVK